MSDADHISRQTNLPAALPSEVEQIREYQETYKLPYPLDQFKDLIDPTECEQPVSGACGSEDCEPGKCCEPCVQALRQAQYQELILHNTLTEQKPCLTSGEVEPQTTWQMTLAAQNTDTVLSYLILQLTTGRSCPGGYKASALMITK